MAAKFKHDCSGCIYLGSDAAHDFYFCGQAKTLPTVIARYGNEGPEYQSGLEVAKWLVRDGRTKEPLAHAYRLARIHGLVK